MDIKKANPILRKKIMYYINNHIPENEFIDYKQEWEHQNSELIKDIFSFVNTIHNKDCYLIIGVTDKGNKIIDVNHDSNRKDQKDIIDMLAHLPIAGGYVPPIKVNTININKKQIDIITIKNTNMVPVYLTESHHFNHEKRSMMPGLIYSRIGDRNTGFNQTTNFHRTKMLWRKHFGIDLPIKKRYLIKLKDIKHWHYYDELLPGAKPCFMYDLDPNYKIELYDDNIQRVNVTPLSVNMYVRPSISWIGLNLEYNHNTIDTNIGWYLDGCRSLTVVPKLTFINYKLTNDMIIYYFIKTKLSYWLNKLVFNVYTKWYFKNELKDNIPIINSYRNKINQITINFTSIKEKDLFFNWIKHNHIKNKINKEIKLHLNRTTLESINGSFKQDNIRINSIHSLKQIIFQYLSAKIYKRYFNNWKS